MHASRPPPKSRVPRNWLGKSPAHKKAGPPANDVPWLIRWVVVPDQREEAVGSEEHE